MRIDIDIFWYTIEPINDNKNGNLQKLEFASRHEVKELVKGNKYDNLKLTLNPETELDTTSQIKNNPHKKKVSEFPVKVIRVYLKSSKVIDYEPHY